MISLNLLSSIYHLVLIEILIMLMYPFYSSFFLPCHIPLCYQMDILLGGIEVEEREISKKNGSSW